jgi:succinate-acetate transporter protein
MPLNTDTGNPAPLGLVAFGLTTVLLSIVNAGLLPTTAGTIVVIPLAMAFGGTAQFVAGILEFRNGNTFAQTAFFSYGAFWWWFALLELFALNGILNSGAQGFASVVGVALILWGVFTLYMWVGTFRLNWGLFSVFLTLWITFFLLGFGDFLGNNGLYVAGGYVGILSGALAMYVSFAEVTNWSFGRTVLPLGSAPISDDSGETAADTAD